MKRGGLVLLSLIVLCLLFPVGTLMADDETENLVSRVLESFDPDTRTTEWRVRGSKFVTYEEGNPELQYPKQQYVKAWPEAVFGANWDDKDYRVLGVKAAFDRQGYNNLEIIPVEDDGQGNVVPNPIPIPGKCKKLDFWVWGSNYNYYMEAHIRDYRGIVHVLNMGSIKHTGWKNLKIDIPPYIPQAVRYIPQSQQLELVKLMVWTTPEEKVDEFYVYVDQIKVLTDDFVSRFDGDDLVRSDRIQEIWGEGTVSGGSSASAPAGGGE